LLRRIKPGKKGAAKTKTKIKTPMLVINSNTKTLAVALLSRRAGREGGELYNNFTFLNMVLIQTLKVEFQMVCPRTGIPSGNQSAKIMPRLKVKNHG
jgi:hypothetical protein